MRQVGIIGIGHTKFGKTEKGFLELLGEAALLCFEDAQITPGPEAGIDQVFVASMGGGMVNHISGSASALADSLHLCPAMAECVENGPASGASAVKLGYMAIASGMCDRVLVVGGEKMNGRGGAAATDFVATMLHPEAEYNCGLTLTSFAAMFTRLIMERYGVTMEDLARVAVKNHANAMHNPYAQLHKRVTLEELTQGELRAVCWGDVNALELREGKSPLEVVLCGCGEDGRMRPLPRQELLLFTALNPEPGSPYGVSLLRSMPFLADILLKIYRTIGKNWERAGNVRYAVVCRPGGDGMERGSASERAGAIAAEWSEAMRDSQSGVVRDFVAVGDVSVKVIGADGPVLDAAVPVRQLLEQLVAKTGLPPFLLGLSWSSTERMSAQQADLLTSELWALRRAVEPVLLRICTLWLRLHGCGCAPEIVWDDISLQDLVEEAQADLYRARTEQLRKGT